MHRHAAVLAGSKASRLVAGALAAAALAEPGAAAAAAAAASFAGSQQSTLPAPDLCRYDALLRSNLGRFRGAETARLACW